MLKDKIEEIQGRLSLNDKELSHLLDINMNTLLHYNNEEIIKTKIKELFNIDEENLKDSSSLPLLKITKNLNMKKYKNKINAYNEVIKNHYTPSWKIYVLTKTKVKEKFSISSLIKKKKIENYPKEFTPSFLAVKNETKLLINFKEEKLLITELDKDVNDECFIEENSKYKKANLLNIK